MADEIQYVTPDILRTELEAQDQRGEFRLRTELEAQDKRFDAKLDALGTELRGEMATLRTELHTMRNELGEAIAAAARGIEESMRAQFGALDDKYRDNPPRLTAVETRVEQVAENVVPRVEHIERALFTPQPPKRRRRAQRR